MDFEGAKALVKTHRNIDKYDTIHVTSDGNVYFNTDVQALEKHCKKYKIEIFQIKPEIKP
jgi:hypothetical protein